MNDRLIIRTTDKDSLKPLVESALERQKKLIQSSLERTRQHLAEFEKRFGMTSDALEKRLNARELAESFDFTDWRMEIGMLHALERKYETLAEAQIVD